MDLIFHANYDRNTIEVQEWTPTATFSWFLVAQAPDHFIRRVGDRIFVKCSNGRAYYRATGYESTTGFECELICSERLDNVS